MTTLAASDGVTLAVHTYTDLDPQRPTILAVHGYPDNHHVWDGVAEQLVEQYPGRYNVAAYDVRGAGESSAPAGKAGYRFPQLVADVGAVIEHLGVDRVHLLGHDWGSIQGWAAITDPALMPKIASYTSISGPHLQYAGRFLRSARSPRGLVDVIRQILGSTYIWLFLTPRLPEVIFGSGLGAKVIDAFERIGRTSSQTQQRAMPRSAGDYRNGLNLYRANMPAPMLFPPRQLPQTDVPVQVLVPRKDIFVTPALQRYTGSIPAGGRVIPIEGGHWVVTSRPDVIARLTAGWVDRVEAHTTPALPAVHTGRRAVGGKLALVTGAGTGIGRATAVELARQGARTVALVGRTLPPLEETAEAVRAAGAEAAVYRLDVADEGAVNDLAAQVKAEHGVVDILVNNAGIALFGRFLETTSEQWEEILAVNLRGVIAGSRAFAAQMVERGEGGTIINVSSAAAYQPSKAMIAYGTAKAAVLAFSESLRADLADDGITVTAVCPGLVNTNIAMNTVYAGRSTEAQEQARTAADAVYRRRNYSPESTAKAIVKAVHTGPAVLPVTPESWIGYAMRRISPTLLRVAARYDIRQG